MAKAEKVATANSGKIIQSFGEFKGVLTWNFIGGEVLEFDALAAAGEGWNNLVPVGRAALLHGFKQKISDAGAMARDPETGLPPESAARIAKMRRVAESLAAGEWELTRTGGGGGSESLLARALAEKFAKPMDVIRAWMKGKTKAELAALKVDKSIAKIITRMEAESGKGVDTGALLAELG
jgi:hypothetical protein